MDSLYIVIPAYNESENIRSVIEDWYPLVEKHNGDGKSRLLLIDDGSRDDTYAIMKEMEESRPLLEAITKKNSGHGSTILYGYQKAVERGADYVFQTDSDGQTLPAEFEPFWRRRERFDMVIGWRRDRQDGFGRILTTKVLKWTVRLCFGVQVKDANTPFRLMKRRALSEVLPRIPEDYNLTNVLISVIFTKENKKIRWIPITFRPRQGGVNSINMKRIVKIGRQAFVDFRKINRALELAERQTKDGAHS